jgi:hypothetical protein
MKRMINLSRASKLLYRLEAYYIKKSIIENIDNGECEYTPLTTIPSLQTATRMLWAHQNIRDQFDLNIAMMKEQGKKNYKFIWTKPARFRGAEVLLEEITQHLESHPDASIEVGGLLKFSNREGR